MSRNTRANVAKTVVAPTSAPAPQSEDGAAYRTRLVAWAELMGQLQDLEAAVERARDDRVIDPGHAADEVLEALKEAFLNLADGVPMRRAAG